ncbi:MAG: type II toxin-antitoxin system RatA family toxin [Methylobacterium sp.]|nr:type II toxin-antitoxin system RatA family toxin [Methylobacterium sp.]MCA3654765.1 type II toxin-antitoxin system RatA family toxin [Methylobacterium sp.]MCA3658405.1 type II toxin-antitoxin system RatA family toxin [Methylobacterium sp.]MCA3662904.1 type II toxin-antitoxin system RatA family toxin [Methylobacterium sp.]MCA3667392.1 type II toxin-antitoxin system RatA family toxin [Methylobacterium sp.]
MPRFETTRLVRHAPQTMFDLVADIERYPEFVPMCTSLVIRRRNSDELGREVLTADMAIGYKMIREVFTTRVVLDRGGEDQPPRILVSYVDGPFRHLENRWTFLPLEGVARPSGEGATMPAPVGCRVQFFIDYEFRSRTFQLLAGAVFETVFRKMAEAFEKRADVLARRGPQG